MGTKEKDEGGAEEKAPKSPRTRNRAAARTKPEDRRPDYEREHIARTGRDDSSPTSTGRGN